jgi:hypothetical protein
MGHQVRAALAVLAVFGGSPAAAQTGAAGVDTFYSSDSDHTEVLKIGTNLDWQWKSSESYQGIRLEKAWFRPVGRRGKGFDRAYVRLADQLGRWKWNASLGTDGHTVLGSASIHNDAKVRQEYFVEREIIETPLGLRRGIYYTFGGAAIDLPVDERNSFSLFGGLQEFTGANVRTHVRGTYVHVLKPKWGLSIQLRARYFHSSRPHEFDYYSPRWYAEVLPVVQVRRFVSGWQLLGAAGLGRQRDSDSGWRSSRYLTARVTSPAFQKGWAVSAAATYSNTPVSSGLVYRYTQFTLGLTKAF